MWQGIFFLIIGYIRTLHHLIYFLFDLRYLTDKREDKSSQDRENIENLLYVLNIVWDTLQYFDDFEWLVIAEV